MWVCFEPQIKIGAEFFVWAVSKLCHCSLPTNTNYPSVAGIFVIIITNANGDQKMKLRQVHSPFFTSCNPYVSVFSVWIPREEARVCTYSAPASFSLCVMTVGVLLLAQIVILISFSKLTQANVVSGFCYAQQSQFTQCHSYTVTMRRTWHVACSWPTHSCLAVTHTPVQLSLLSCPKGGAHSLSTRLKYTEAVITSSISIWLHSSESELS